MNIIFNTLLKDKSVKQLQKFIVSNQKIQINSLDDSLKAAIFAAIFKNNQMVVIFPDQISLNTWRDDFISLLPNISIQILPELDFFDVNAAVKSLNLYAQRINILDKLTQSEKIIVLATASAAVNPVVSPKIFLNSKITIKVGDTLEFNQLISNLVEFGYQRDGEVDSIGHFAIRGGIIDIFPVNASAPLRIEFFDNIIDSIRIFDLNDKRSVKKISQFLILPVTLIDNDSEI